jgi:hypothetical protein
MNTEENSDLDNGGLGEGGLAAPDQEQLEAVDQFTEEPDPVEDETDVEDLLISDLEDALVQATDWTVGTIIDQIERGRIQLNPNFQRRDAWTDTRKSKFIESLLIGFPIPQLVLAEARGQRGRYIVIDGKQRLLSLIQFAGSQEAHKRFRPLRLRGMDLLSDMNGYTRKRLEKDGTLSPRLDDFENRTIRTVVIRHWNHEAILYHIFLRLNTGSVQLSPQELRNALHPGNFGTFIDDYSVESPALRRILGRRAADFRMRDAELLLRYYAFQNFISSYAGSMKSFLDFTTEQLNSQWDSIEGSVREQAGRFEEAVHTTYDIFSGSDAFRKWKNGSFSGRFNRAVFDVMIFHFCVPSVSEVALARREAVKEAFIELSATRPDFVSALESSTKSLGATFTRFSLWTEILSGAIDMRLPQFQMGPNSRIQVLHADQP